MTRDRKYYSKEFKLKAIELSYARESVKQVAEELGIRPTLLYKWRSNLLTVKRCILLKECPEF